MVLLFNSVITTVFILKKEHISYMIDQELIIILVGCILRSNYTQITLILLQGIGISSQHLLLLMMMKLLLVGDVNLCTHTFHLVTNIFLIIIMVQVIL